MNLKKWLKKSFFRGVSRFFLLALFASGADAALFAGIKLFMQILSGESSIEIYWWLLAMIFLTGIRLLFLAFKVDFSERWLYRSSSGVQGWFLHRLRRLSPRVFHTPEGDRQVEAAYEATQVFQASGSVLFQAVQAVLQLAVFLPVLIYISWPLALFLFAVVVPVVAMLQRKLHKMGPAEESLLWERSDFRSSLNRGRRLFRQWSSAFERQEVSRDLTDRIRNLRDHGLRVSIQKLTLSQVTEAVSVLAMVFVLSFCALLIQRGWMNGESLVLFCSAVLICYKPVKECARVLPQCRSLASAIRVLESFEALPKRENENLGVGVSGGENTNEKILQIQNKSFRYEGSAFAVYENFSAEFSREKPVLVRGKNGVGKSTLLRLLAGLEQWEDGSWTSSLAGEKHNVFFVAQDLELPPLGLLRRLLDQTSGPSRRLLQDFAATCGAERLLDKNSMSGGERSRLALLWALASDCSTLLLDEPFASIALADREPLLTALLDVAAARKKWVVVVSHDVLSPDVESRFNVIHFGEVS